VTVSDAERNESVKPEKRLDQLGQMNVDLEALIREVYKKIKYEEVSKADQNQAIEVSH